MQRIPLQYAEPGMVLAQSIVRDNGMVLMAEGTELNQSGIERLHRLGVGHLTVQGEPVDMAEECGGVSCSKRLERLDHLFRGYEDDQWMLTVKTFFQTYFHKRGAQRGELSANDHEDDA